MKKSLKKLFKWLLVLPTEILLLLFKIYEGLLSVAFGGRIAAIGRTRLLGDINNRTMSTTYQTSALKTIDITVSVPNSLCMWRADTLYTKERSLIEWVELYGGKGSFFDIGANTGLFSILYAKLHPGKVYAFEPSSQNATELQKNIALNKFGDQICLIPNPLSDTTCFNPLEIASEDAGAAYVSFGDVATTQEQITPAYTKTDMLGFSLDDMFKLGLLDELPSMIKIDVDGIESKIVAGAQQVLRSDDCRTVCVEVVPDVTADSSEISRLLSDAGFKNRSDNFTYASEEMNQIWLKGD